jgi:hypothetical protein
LFERTFVVKKGFIRDLFMGPNNEHWDLGRIIAGFTNLAMVLSIAWNISLGLPLDVDKIGIGVAAVLGACAALIYAKDRARAENLVATAIEEEAN